MDPERWRLVEGVLHEALEREPHERDAWLAKRCGDDPGLRDEVRSLIALEERSRQFLETPALAVDPPSIGEYRIVQRIATGGTGVVYEARGGEPEQSCAIKVLRGGPFVEDRQLRRFRREVKALARLRHPSIARIFEAGRTEVGERYFSMELVRGEPIDDHARRLELPLDERLRLFLQLCEGVEYAHGRGVVHRDLKPGNVLVDADGRPRILDFGIARTIATDGDRSSSTEHTGEVLGTLTHMSPEQARGQPGEIDERSDVYSLGVLLYQLITDRLPYALTRVLPPQALRVICEQEPLRPSAVRAELRGDLETIVLQALEKDPDRRYASVRALADDVGAFLERRSISARPPGVIHQLRRFAAAHKLASSVVAASFVALAVFAGTVWIKNRELFAKNREVLAAEADARTQAARAREQSSKAIEQSRKAVAALDFMSEALGSVDPDRSRGRDLTMREFLEQAARRLEEGAEQHPLVRAELHGLIGRAFLALGKDPEAERHLRQRLALLREQGAERSMSLVRTRGELAGVLERLGRYGEAVDVLGTAIGEYREVHGDDAVVAGMSLDLGRVLAALGRREDALRRREEALAIGPPTRADGPVESVESLEFQADGSRLQGDLPGAEERLVEALELQILQDGERHTRTAHLLAKLAMVRVEAGRPQEALEPMERSLSIRRELLDADHPERVATLQNLATLHVSMGHYSEAEPLLTEVLERWQDRGDAQHEDFAATLSTLGVIHSELRRPERAVDCMREALEVYRVSAANDAAVLASYCSNLAHALETSGRTAEARSYAAEALQLRRGVYGAQHPAVADGLVLLGELHLADGELRVAEEHFREALAMYEQLLLPDHLDVGIGANGLAVVLQRLGELEEAEALLRRALEIYRVALGEAHPRVALCMGNLGDVLLGRGEAREAEPLLARALEVARAELGEDHPDVAARAAALERARRDFRMTGGASPETTEREP